MADEHGKPRFTNPAGYDGLIPIAVLELSDTNAAPNMGYRAFANPGSCTFHLWRDVQDIGFFSLPSYQAAPPATFWRTGLTPVTVAADAAMVGVFCMGQAAHWCRRKQLPFGCSDQLRASRSLGSIRRDAHGLRPD